MVANPWRRLLIGNFATVEPDTSAAKESRQSLATPIDWKPHPPGRADAGLLEPSPILGDAY